MQIFLDSNFSIILILLATVVGLAALWLTPREEDPQIVVPLADVLVSLPGHSAAEVEQLVATPLEKILYQIDGVEYVYSMAARTRRSSPSATTSAGPRAQPGQAVQEDQRKPGHRPAGRHRLGGQAGGDRRRAGRHADAHRRGRRRHDAAPRRRGGRPAALGAVRTCRGPMSSAASRASSGSTSTPNGMQAYRAQPAGGPARDPGGQRHAHRPATSRADDTVISVEGGRRRSTSPSSCRELVVGVFQDRPVFLKDVADVERRPRRGRQLRPPRLGPGARIHAPTRASRAPSVGEHAAAAAATTQARPATRHRTPAVTLAIAKQKGTNAVWVAEAVLRAGRGAADARSCPPTWSWSSPATRA